MRPVTQNRIIIVALATLFVVGIAPNWALAQQPPSPDDPFMGRAAASPSESPHLQSPADSLPPVARPPERTPKLPVSELATITHELATMRTFQTPKANAGSANETSDAIPGYKGLLPGEDTGAETDNGRNDIIGADGRTQVTNTTDFPWRTIVHLEVSFPSGGGGCTGEMIDSFHILTAGHCVHDGSSWANSIKVYPGRSGSSTPYNYAWATWFRSYTNWTVNQDWNHDWAVVTLDRRIGNFTGWMGRITQSSSSGIYTGTVNNAGYPDLAPGGTSGGARMYYDADSGRTANEYKHWYYNDTRPGNSGGPVWYYDGTNRYIMTIHAYGNDGTGSNSGTRLNGDKYDRTSTWLADDAPSPPTDRPDLVNDGQTWMYASPTTVVAGDTTISVGSDVRNVGTASAGGHWDRYVLSTNSTISTGDYTLCEAYVASVGSFNWANSDCTGTVSASIPAGTYYLGVIHDVYNWATEFDEGNNTGVKTTYFVTVKAKYALGVSKAGSGTGTVTSSPAGINCGADCSESYVQGAVVSLTATPAAGSSFASWSGACAGSGACNVTMSAAKNVTATFNVFRTLTVSKTGGGAGTVTSNPVGINCGADCSQSFVQGTVVALTATASAGSTFVSWSGACAGSGACNVTMSISKTVTANFALLNGLTVNKTGLGTVTSAPAGINCGADCSESYASGAVVALTATPAAGYGFSNWTGGCTGKVNPCNITMSTSKTVTAVFKLVADLRLTKTDSPDPISVGNTLTYTIVVSNLGPNASSGVKVTDTLPVAFTYVSSAASQGTIVTAVVASGATKVTWTAGAIANGGGATLTIVGRPTVAGTLRNTANISAASTFDPNTANNHQTAATTVNP